MIFVFTEKHVLTHYVSYNSKICVSTFPKTNVSDSGPRLLQLTFLVQKTCGSWQPVINLLSVNAYVTFIKLKMEVVSLVLEGDVMLSIDLKDVYI